MSDKEKLEFSDLERIDKAFVDLWKVINEYREMMQECRNYEDLQMLLLLTTKINEAESFLVMIFAKALCLHWID